MPTSTLHLGSFTCRKATTWDRRLYFPSEGRRAEDFFALKIRRLRPGVNPRTWVPNASTLSLDHRSRFQDSHCCLYMCYKSSDLAVIAKWDRQWHEYTAMECTPNLYCITQFSAEIHNMGASKNLSLMSFL